MKPPPPPPPPKESAAAASAAAPSAAGAVSSYRVRVRGGTAETPAALGAAAAAAGLQVVEVSAEAEYSEAELLDLT